MKNALTLIALSMCLFGCGEQESNTPLNDPVVGEAQEKTNEIDKSLRGWVVSTGKYCKSILDEINETQETPATEQTK